MSSALSARLLLLISLACVLHAAPLPDTATLSLDEKIGQLLMTRLHATEPNEEAVELIQRLHVGSIVYYQYENGLSDVDQIRTLSAGLQKLAMESSHIPLILAADQEGGRVVRLPLAPGELPTPSAKELGQGENEAEIRSWGVRTGRALRSVGINMNLAPVVDVARNDPDAYISDRSFSSDPSKVTRYALHMLQGLREASVLTCLKHYPGHGSATVDSHLGLPVLQQSWEALVERDLRPFRSLIPEANAIMTGHLLVPALDPAACSTLSAPTLRYLREDLGFKGVILADSLHMRGVLDQAGSIETAATRAFQAGCDLLILGGQIIDSGKPCSLSIEDIARVHAALKLAVESGVISTERLDASVQRLLDLKAKLVGSAGPHES
ncbi:MAG: glycoside hydrolase family 3 N-terminal domain-containing protein [Chlamydiia bacterium]